MQLLKFKKNTAYKRGPRDRAETGPGTEFAISFTEFIPLRLRIYTHYLIKYSFIYTDWASIVLWVGEEESINIFYISRKYYR